MYFDSTKRNMMLVGVAIALLTSSLSAQGLNSGPAQANIAMTSDGQASGSTKKGNQVTVNMLNVPLRDILNEISRQGGIRIVYPDRLVDKFSQRSVKFTGKDPESALREALLGTNLTFVKTSANQLSIVSRNESQAVDTDSVRSSLSGRVVDSATKEGLSGVTITLAGSPISVRTDVKGVFVIRDLKMGEHTLIFRALGYNTSKKTVLIEKALPVSLQITLAASVNSLTEIVTTATGAQRRVEVAHDIAKIDADAVMQRSPVRSVTDLLEAAQVPGLLIQRQSGDPGSPTKIRIRGIGSISQSNDPVVILDGVWIDGSMGRPSRLDDIDPATIESIEIVRGPSAATLYGQDASNGIIVITSKKGNIGKTRWNLQYSRDWGEAYGKKPLVYIGQGRGRIIPTAMRCDIAHLLAYQCIQDSVNIYDPNNRLLLQEGTATNNSINLQMDGGVNAIQYSISARLQEQIGARRNAPIDIIRARIVGHVVEDAYLKPSKRSIKSLTSSFTMNPMDNLSVAFNVSGVQSDLTDNHYTMSFRNTLNQWSLDTVNISASSFASIKNPVKSTNVVMGSNVSWRPTPAYVVNGTLGVERFNGNDNKLTARQLEDPINSSYDATSIMQQDNKTIYTARVNASTSLNLGSFGRFLEIRPSIGGDYRKNDDNRFSFTQSNIPFGESAVVGGENSTAYYIRTANATAGWYINSTFGLFQRLYFDLGIRQDIGSAITSSENSRYPKLGTSWLVSDEPFWPQNNFINLLRLRGAVGHAAVQPDLTDIRGGYVAGYAYVNGRYVNSFDQTQVGNPRLNPERATEFELGFDTDVLYDRINLILTYSRSQNKNTLIDRSLPTSIGLSTGSSRKENVARVLNANLELASTIRALERKDHQLTLNYTLTLSNNRVLRLGHNVSPFHSSNVSRVQEGYPLGGVWSRVVMGYMDFDNNGLLSREEMVLSDSLAFLGWTHPKIKASYGLSWTINNSITFDSRFAYQGNYVQSMQTSDVYGLASKDAPLADQAIANVLDLVGKRSVSDLRWNSASISYFLPAPLVSRLRARSVNISLQASNLALWTNYMGRDPGVNSSLTDGEFLSDNGTTLPAPRLYVFTFRWGI